MGPYGAPRDADAVKLRHSYAFQPVTRVLAGAYDKVKR